MAETQSIAPIGTDVSESGGSSVFEHDRVVAQHDGIHEASVGSSLVISRDPRFVGTGFFAGEAPDGLTTVYGDPIPSDVFVYWRDHDDPLEKEVLVGAAKSAQDGTWCIVGLNYNLQYVIRARAQGYDDATVVGARPSRSDVIAYVNHLEPTEYFDGLTGHVLLDSGLPPFTCEVIQPLPYGLSARIEGRKLLIDGASTDNGVRSSVVRVTASNGVWVDVPVQVQVQIQVFDPHLDKVVALLHFDGDLTDETGRVWSPVMVPSFALGGVANSLAISGAAATPYSAALDVLNDDFTIEFFVFASSWETWAFNDPIGSTPMAFGKMNASDHINYWSVGPNSGGRLALYVHNNGNRLHLQSQASIPINELTHVSVMRIGNSILMSINGQVEVVGTAGSNLMLGDSATPFTIGRSLGVTRVGLQDELRITKGVARYTENFTPLTRQFPNQ